MSSHSHVLGSAARSALEAGQEFDADSLHERNRCYDHGCNGREFSTFSNLLRHQREREGNSSKSSCPKCGAEFTRSTARNSHIKHGKCKGRRDSNISDEAFAIAQLQASNT